MDNKSVSCWGANNYGQLGIGSSGGTDVLIPNTSLLPTGRTATQISAGTYHACALLDNGSVSCWGRNEDGQIGIGSTVSPQSSPVTALLPSGRTATQVECGAYHACALLDNSSISCWGQNEDGQIGTGGSGADVTTPTTVTLPSGRTATKVAAGGWFSCALLDNASISCWGQNDDGEMGIGSTVSDQLTPVTALLPTGRTATEISGGWHHACAVLDNGSVSCWGLNDNGQVGIGSHGSDITTPTTSLCPLGE